MVGGRSLVSWVGDVDIAEVGLVDREVGASVVAVVVLVFVAGETWVGRVGVRGSVGGRLGVVSAACVGVDGGNDDGLLIWLLIALLN